MKKNLFMEHLAFALIAIRELQISETPRIGGDEEGGQDRKSDMSSGIPAYSPTKDSTQLDVARVGKLCAKQRAGLGIRFYRSTSKIRAYMTYPKHIPDELGNQGKKAARVSGGKVERAKQNWATHIKAQGVGMRYNGVRSQNRSGVEGTGAETATSSIDSEDQEANASPQDRPICKCETTQAGHREKQDLRARSGRFSSGDGKKKGDWVAAADYLLSEQEAEQKAGRPVWRLLSSFDSDLIVCRMCAGARGHINELNGSCLAHWSLVHDECGGHLDVGGGSRARESGSIAQ
ncbi:hypothetical protein C8R47DRAFT_1080574 [Mycena vitilis]|nr:hypothetical protein C8R47DRAFT_1080574 [Mycena vitilis]